MDVLPGTDFAAEWMQQMDRDREFCEDPRETLAADGIGCLALPVRAPNLNGYAERWVCSVKSECFSKLILFGKPSLRRALKNFCAHHEAERNQGKDNKPLFPRRDPPESPGRGTVRCEERLRELLNYYHRKVA